MAYRAVAPKARFGLNLPVPRQGRTAQSLYSPRLPRRSAHHPTPRSALPPLTSGLRPTPAVRRSQIDPEPTFITGVSGWSGGVGPDIRSGSSDLQRLTPVRRSPPPPHEVSPPPSAACRCCAFNWSISTGSVKNYRPRNSSARRRRSSSPEAATLIDRQIGKALRPDLAREPVQRLLAP